MAKHVASLAFLAVIAALALCGCGRQQGETVRPSTRTAEAAPAPGASWPQYLGPTRNALSPERGLLRSWPETGPKVLWTVKLGKGYGGAAVSDGKVYVLDRNGSSGDVLRCLDSATGAEEWTFAYDSPGRVSHEGSRTVPAIDGDYVYTSGPFGDLYCLDTQTHKPVWEKNFWKDCGGERMPNWALSQNPLVYGDLLIVAPQTPKVGVVAYDKETGEVKWESPPLPGGRAGYVSPALVNLGGQDQIIMIAPGPRQPRGSKGGKGRRTRPRGKAGKGTPSGAPPADEPKGATVALDPSTGKTLWSYDGWQCQLPVANVTAIDDGRLFITGGYDAGSAMIKVEKRGAEFAVTELYKTQDFGTHVHPAVLYDGHLYGHCTTNTRRDGLVCMDLDGNVKWKTGRDPVFDKGGFVLADGLLFSVDGRAGVLYLIEPNPNEYKQLASAELLDRGESWAPLTLVDGKLFIRDQGQMKCVAVR